ncbi:insulinase family protein, partial [bacterium]|nr:insulinase family protein [bacterium]
KLLLQNGMKVMLISDEETKKSSVALAVGVGQWDDDPNYPGIAHFCEHMLFMGSKKYPAENGYKECLARGAGYSNAYTADTRTVYYFVTASGAFDESLDHFSRFFIDPLFLVDSVEREANAIEEEYQRSKNSEGLRIAHVLKQEGNPKHPNHRFSWGCKETIGNIPREKMIAWYKEHYSADNMTLCIYSNKSMQELKEQVVSTFSPIKKRETPQKEIPTSTFSDNLKASLLQVQTIKDTKELIINWELENQSIETTRALYLLFYALNHSTKGGLNHFLKEEGLTYNLVASANLNSDNNLLCNISAVLTEKGFAEIEEVITQIFAALHSLKEKGIPIYLHEDFQNHLINTYEWKSRPPVESISQAIAADLLLFDFGSYPQEHIDLGEYKPHLYKELIDKLCPHNAVFVVCNNFTGEEQYLDQVEPYHNVSYHMEKIDTVLLDYWQNIPAHKEPILPTKNPFISKDVKLFSRDLPPLLIKNEKGVCYFFKDEEFSIPRVQTYVGIKNPVFEKNAFSTVLASLYFTYLQREMETGITQKAAFAEIYSGISFNNFKMSLYIDAYHDKIEDYLPIFVDALKNIELDEQKFNDLKHIYLVHCKNAEYAPPLQKGGEIIGEHTNDVFVTTKEFATILATLTLDDLKNMHERVFTQNYLEVLVAGDTGIENAQNIFHILTNSLCVKDYNPEQHPQLVQIPFWKEGDTKTLRIESTTKAQGNGMLLLMDQGENTPEKKAVHSILSHFLHEAYFDSLRTKQQLCYAISASLYHTKKRCMGMFSISTSRYSADTVLQKTYEFMQQYRLQIEECIAEESFNAMKESCLEKLEEPFKTPQAASRSINSMLFESKETYKAYYESKNAVKNLTYEQFIEIAKEMLDLEHPEKKMEVLITGDAN